MEPLLPRNPGRGGRWADHRRTINRVLWRTRTTREPSTSRPSRSGSATRFGDQEHNLNRMSVCPGCRLELPDERRTSNETRYNASPECLRLSGEVAAFNHAHPARLAIWHQTCVDAYGAQHVSAGTKPIAVAFALNGLYLVFERGFTGLQARNAHGYLANTVPSWPRFTPPDNVGKVTVFDVTMASSVGEHIDLVQTWGRSVWAAWSHVHNEIATMTDAQLGSWHPHS
ncbi:DUF5946 family protein [Nonomuraea terrae]|uniref:DUF5946 family protein n=2 Tax=Nonomuraea TaxID=83681 RepID=UPI0037BA4E9B